MKKVYKVLMAIVALCVVSGCSSDATVATENIKKDAEQLEWKEESKYKYKIIFKPESIIPFDFDKE